MVNHSNVQTDTATSRDESSSDESSSNETTSIRDDMKINKIVYEKLICKPHV